RILRSVGRDSLQRPCSANSIALAGVSGVPAAGRVEDLDCWAYCADASASKPTAISAERLRKEFLFIKKRGQAGVCSPAPSYFTGGLVVQLQRKLDVSCRLRSLNHTSG